MPSVTLEKVGRRAAAASVACLIGLGLGAAPALAGDDGAAPMWVSLSSIINWGGDKVEAPIDYRDHPRLVVPPKIDLPPPAAAPSASATNWPRDPDLESLKKRQAEERPHLSDNPSHRRGGSSTASIIGVVTTDYTAGKGPSTRGRCTAGPGQSCDSAPSPSINWNPLTWIGVEKKPQTVLGPEPDRDSLTDPPVGYRAPAEGAGVKIDSN